MDRFVTREQGRLVRHSFSFGSSYDPERVGFGPLFALNDELLGSAAGYDAHEHRDVVLVTWVVTGRLAHEDAGGCVPQPAGELAITRTGSGITHSERADGVATRFVQAWLRPDAPGGGPHRRTTAPDRGGGDLVVVADEGELGIAGAAFRLADLPAGASVRVPQARRRHVFVATGALVRSSLAEPLAAGDAFEVTGDHVLAVAAGVPTQLLVWSFDA
jgi:redox-sensitive bicupin YhaK (pirin superfamily)